MARILCFIIIFYTQISNLITLISEGAPIGAPSADYIEGREPTPGI